MLPPLPHAVNGCVRLGRVLQTAAAAAICTRPPRSGGFCWQPLGIASTDAVFMPLHW